MFFLLFLGTSINNYKYKTTENQLIFILIKFFPVDLFNGQGERSKIKIKFFSSWFRCRFTENGKLIFIAGLSGDDLL